MIGGTDKAHSYARMPCTRANGDVCAIRSRPVPPIKYFCLFSSSSSFPFVCAKVDQLVPKVWHKSKITEKRRVLRLVPESGTSHDHVGTGGIHMVGTMNYETCLLLELENKLFLNQLFLKVRTLTITS